MSHNYLTVLLHGESKVGKTTLAATAPRPLLVLDAEAGGMRFVEGVEVREWRPSDPIPAEPGEDVIVRIQVTKMAEIAAAYRVLSQSEHPFQSVVLDSLTEIQSRFKRELDPDGMLEIQHWGTMLTKLEDLVMQFRDLCEHPKFPLRAFIAISGSKMKDGKYRPLLQGAIVSSLPYKVDVNGFLFTHKDEAGLIRRGLRVRGSDIHDVGCRPPQLSDIEWDPNISDMLTKIFEEKTS